MDYLKRAKELFDETVVIRRRLHRIPEVSMELPQTSAYVMEQLTKLGYAPRRCGGTGVTAAVGGGGSTILLRADMDALPMREESGLPFASTRDAAHTCGHDFHTAMLLTAARMLKENEAALKGTVKLMFQPGEETLLGAKAMIADGLLEDPVPDAALGFHIGSGQKPPTTFFYNSEGAMMNSNDGFRITLQGRGVHGAYPETGVDPINIAVHLYLTLDAIIAREVSVAQASSITVGRFSAGSTYNIIPDTAELQGSIRSDSPEQRELLVRRVREAAGAVAGTYHGAAQVEMISSVPPLICDPEFTEACVDYMRELDVPGQTGIPGMRSTASDDFACVLERVPGAYIYLSAGFPDRPAVAQHNSRVVFNEEVLQYGPAYLAHCAARWLEEHGD